MAKIQPFFLKTTCQWLLAALLFASASSAEEPRLVGEFEPQKAILLSVSDWQPHHKHILVEILQKSRGHVEMVVLYNDESQLSQTINWLRETKEEYPHVSFLRLDLNTIWLRDFAPRIAQAETNSVSLDFFYNGVRPKDDAMPRTWAEISGAKYKGIRWTIQGGNLIGNGRGLALTTTRIFEDNKITFSQRFPSQTNPIEEARNIVIKAFKEGCNVDDLVILQPLEVEATKHVDMFCTLLKPDLAVVASVDARRDPANARILDWNARRLQQLNVDGKPMRVERINIPVRQSKYWSPYTNVILANDLLLMPIYDSDPRPLVRQAVEQYERLLPGYTVETVNMTSMQKLEGALHCLSVNVPAFAKLPSTTPYSSTSAKPSLPNLAHEQSAQQVEENSLSSSRSSKNKSESKRAARVADEDASRFKQRQSVAAHTYLRRLETQEGMTAKAYVIGVSGDTATLLLKENLQQSEVTVSNLRSVDQQWLRKHAAIINRNGERVKNFLLSNQ